uniref:DUF5600 domain-containing protein n=1 Tax=Panagrolaimus superbus TaxID=310955 RepID=A0A914YJF9_9BILA
MIMLIFLKNWNVSQFNIYLEKLMVHVIKRAKSVRVHALIMDQMLRKMWYKTEKQRTLMLRDKKLKAIFLDIKLKYRMAESDMPDYESFKDLAAKSYLKSWNKINPKMLLKLEEFLMKDVTK